MEKFRLLIAKKIRDRRIKMGFKTQESFANAMGVEQTQVSRWERGDHLPQEKHHKKLFEILKTDASLLDLDDEDLKRSEYLESILKELPALDNDKLRLLSFITTNLALFRGPDSLALKRRVIEFLEGKKKDIS